jgi:hypothetical protein
MKTRSVITWVLGAAMLAATSATAAPARFSPPAMEPGAELASGNCNAVGQQTAQQMGGQLHSASMENQNGRPVCVIVVVIPGRDGNRGQRERVVVPL